MDENGKDIDEVKRLPALVPQPHGGAIWSGGVPGNAGGRCPPSALREIAREDYKSIQPKLRAIANGELAGARPSDMVRAAAEISKVGFGTNITREDVRVRVHAQSSIIRETLAPELAEELIRRIRAVWAQ